MCEEEDFVWVTWVGNKNSLYNRFRKFLSAVIAEPKTKRSDIETNDGKF